MGTEEITVREYLAALKENRLLGARCLECGFITAPPRRSCRKCGGHQTAAVELSGKGRIATFTSVYVPTENRRGKTPYLVVLTALEEGPWIMGNLSGVDPAGATLELIGMKVRMDNNLSDVNQPDGIVPLFVPDEE